MAKAKDNLKLPDPDQAPPEPAKPIVDHDAFLREELDRRQAKFAAIEAEARESAVEAEEVKLAASKEAPVQDHVPPFIGAREIMVTFAATVLVAEERKLQALARKHPAVKRLLEAAKPAEIPVKAAPAEAAPQVRDPDELPAV